MPRKRQEGPIVVADVRVRPIRSRGARGPQDSRLYWRAELREQTVWTGWATRDEAQAAVVDLVNRGIEGMRPQVADIRTVADLLGSWVGTVIDQRANLARRSAEAIRGRKPDDEDPKRKATGSVGRLVAGLRHVELDRLTPQVIDTYVQERLHNGNATYTVRFDLSALRRAWAWGRSIGATPNRDLHWTRIKVGPQREKRTPDLDAIRKVIDWLAKNGPPWAVPLLHLQAATGARIGEVAAVRPADIDLEAGTVKVTGKTGPRVVPVRRSVLRLALDTPPARAATSDTVWRVRPATAENVLYYVHEANDALGMPRWTTHGLRRLAVDQLARSGVEVAVAAKMMGHSPEVMLAAYRQVTAEDLRAGAAKARLGLAVGDGVVDLDDERERRQR